MAIEILYNHSDESTTFLGTDGEVESLVEFAGTKGIPGELSPGSGTSTADDTPTVQGRALFRGLSHEAAEALIQEFRLFAPT